MCIARGRETLDPRIRKFSSIYIECIEGDVFIRVSPTLSECHGDDGAGWCEGDSAREVLGGC